MATSTPWNPATGLNTYPAIAAVPALVPNAPTSETAPATAATATAATRAVDGNELMSKGVENLINKDSGLMQQAAGAANRTANSRGLLNSSMAVQAGQAAVMDKAMPIAQYDAGVTTNVLNNNLANEQQTNTFNAGNLQDVNKFNASNTQQNNQFNADKQNNNNIVNASETNKLVAQMVDSETKKQLMDIEAGYKTLMQSEASASSLYQQSVKNISEIMMNPDLDAAAKTAAVNNQNSLLQSGMKIIGKMSNLNLDDLLTFPTV
jgi:hypothetical protein